MMPLLHLLDRPEQAHLDHRWQRQGLSAAAAGGTHVMLALALMVFIQHARAPREAATVAAFNPQRMIWIPSAFDGGGKTGGGDQSASPARAARAPGMDPATIPVAAAQPSTTAVEPPLEPLPINARSMSGETQALIGAINSDAVSTTLGRNPGGGTGDGDGPDRGAGRGIGDGFGDAPRAGSPGVTTPIALQQVKPQYTADAMRAKVQGAVWLECVVLTDGSVGDVRVTRSLDQVFGLDQEAIAAARRWRFKPGTMNAKPVPEVVSIELTFSLR